MKVFNTHVEFKLDIEKRLKKAIIKEFKLNKYGWGFSFNRMFVRYIKVKDIRGEVTKEFKIQILRKSDSTHAFIKCKSLNQTQPDFEYKFPARHVDVEYKNSPYERRIKDAFAVNELKLSLMIKALTAWIKEEIESGETP